LFIIVGFLIASPLIHWVYLLLFIYMLFVVLNYLFLLTISDSRKKALKNEMYSTVNSLFMLAVDDSRFWSFLFFNTRDVRTPTLPTQKPLLCRGGGIIVYLSGPGWSLSPSPLWDLHIYVRPRSWYYYQNASWCKWASAINSMSPRPKQRPPQRDEGSTLQC